MGKPLPDFAAPKPTPDLPEEQVIEEHADYLEAIYADRRDTLRLPDSQPGQEALLFAVKTLREVRAIERATMERGSGEVVGWMKQERERHAKQHLGKSFEEVLAHFYQHKDISLDR